MSIEDKLQVNIVHVGDALAVLRTLPACCVDALICDPPSSIGFMGKTWDSDKGGRTQWVAWLASIMAEALRVLKPGGHALVWALPRTSHWTTCALEDAGFEIRDKLYHLFASGYPKSYNIAKGIEGVLTRGSANWTDWKYLSGERQKGENIAYGMTRSNAETGNRPRTYVSTGAFELDATTEEAKRWEGWGTALKPAVEEWILCRKPLTESSVARNVLEWGTGGLNIRAVRVGTEPRVNQGMSSLGVMHDDDWRPRAIASVVNGRWPAHLLISHAAHCQPGQCVSGCPALKLDEQSGFSQSHEEKAQAKAPSTRNVYGKDKKRSLVGHNDQGGVSRYFTQFYYAPKASREERNRGCEGLPEQQIARMGHGNDEPDGRTQSFISQPQANIHPTVKNQQLMRWLCRLITPPHGIVLDCFAGSGSTGVAAIAEGFQFIGIELDPEYAAVAHARIAHALKEAEREAGREKQLSMFDCELPKSASVLLALPGLWDDEETEESSSLM